MFPLLGLISEFPQTQVFAGHKADETVAPIRGYAASIDRDMRSELRLNRNRSPALEFNFQADIFSSQSKKKIDADRIIERLLPAGCRDGRERGLRAGKRANRLPHCTPQAKGLDDAMILRRWSQFLAAHGHGAHHMRPKRHSRRECRRQTNRNKIGCSFISAPTWGNRSRGKTLDRLFPQSILQETN
jgi:hypothetical protein